MLACLNSAGWPGQERLRDAPVWCVTHIPVASPKAAPATATRREACHQDFGRFMIRNENEYKDAVRRLGEQAERLKPQAAQLKQTKLSKDAIKRVLDPVRSFHEQIKEEVASYERQGGRLQSSLSVPVGDTRRGETRHDLRVALRYRSPVAPPPGRES